MAEAPLPRRVFERLAETPQWRSHVTANRWCPPDVWLGKVSPAEANDPVLTIHRVDDPAIVDWVVDSNDRRVRVVRALLRKWLLTADQEARLVSRSTPLGGVFSWRGSPTAVYTGHFLLRHLPAQTRFWARCRPADQVVLRGSGRLGTTSTSETIHCRRRTSTSWPCSGIMRCAAKRSSMSISTLGASSLVCALRRSGPAARRLLPNLLSPDPHHLPAERLKSAVRVGAARSVGLDLLPPETGVRFGPSPMCGTTMPEASVHEDGHLESRELT